MDSILDFSISDMYQVRVIGLVSPLFVQATSYADAYHKVSKYIHSIDSSDSEEYTIQSISYKGFIIF